ncbi:hypothetical protein FACS1894122_15100 [Alphaproteobacteria bacterium]|nr:hypothetical protein FACS1894122_15100 [Alphaproteobacteria bacterium]
MSDCITCISASPAADMYAYRNCNAESASKIASMHPSTDSINACAARTVTLVTLVINLDRATERLSYVLPNISALCIPYEVVSAIDGKELSQETVESIVDIESYVKFFKMLPEPGTIGCSLSHEKALKRFLESDNEFAVIFEDDVSFDPAQLSEIIKELMEKKHLWDIVSFELNHHGHPMKIAQLSHEKSLVFYLTNVKHAGAYMINRDTACKLLKYFYPIKMPFDHYFTRSWELGIKFCGVEPRIVEQKFGNSQIKVSESKKIRSARILAHNFCYNVSTSIKQTAYNLFCYLSHRWF